MNFASIKSSRVQFREVEQKHHSVAVTAAFPVEIIARIFLPDENKWKWIKQIYFIEKK